ncbi:MAG TPA: hypothetical protein PKY59_13220 [Pyrinomonadaceae bacterium]|nr:hypothetical protein [Pyrinomonadaceae bacterium]
MIFAVQINFAQTLPTPIKSFLDKTYKGWKLQKDSCDPNAPGKAVVSGNFNGDKKLDYAVKFVQGKKGFIVAFLARQKDYKAFVLHKTDANDVKTLSLDVWKKGERFELGGQDVVPKYDAPSDFRCESDVGGIHLYRNGKFRAY